jgi:hypothetical protein
MNRAVSVNFGFANTIFQPGVELDDDAGRAGAAVGATIIGAEVA